MSSLTEDLKNHIDIMDVVGRYVELKRAGSNYTGLCPFHREKSPSFMVSREKQIYKCFGCGAGGDVISFMMEYEKIDFWDAIKELSQKYHFDLTPYQSEKKVEGYLDNKDQREKLKLINKYTASRFAQQLSQSSEAEGYLSKQRHISQSTQQEWTLGYAPQQGQQLITHLVSKGFTYSDLSEAGIAKQSPQGEYYSFFRHRIIFPIHDHIGNIVGFGGRIINTEDNPKYLNTTETPIYHKSTVLYGLYQAKSSIKTHQKVIIVEGYMDVIALSRMNLIIGVAPCGTSLTPEHIKLLTRHTTNIIAMFDNDNAGQIAALRSVKLMLEQGLYPQLIILPAPYKDIDDIVNSDLTDDEKQHIINTTVDRFDGIIQQLSVKYPLDHPVASKQLINEMFTVMSAITDFSVFMGYLDKLASYTGIDSNGLLNQYKQRHRNHKQHNHQQSQLTPGYEEDRDTLLLSIQHLNHYQTMSEQTKQLYQLALQLQQLNTQEQTKQHNIDEGLLWRSKSLDTLGIEKIEQEVTGFITRFIQSHTQFIIKSSQLTLDEKHSLLQQVRILSTGTP